MRAARAAQFRHRRARAARIEQESVDMGRVGGDQRQSLGPLHVDHLHAPHVRQQARQFLDLARVDMADDLHGGRLRGAHVFGDGLRRRLGRQQKRGDWRRRPGGDLRDARVGNRTGAGRHGRHQAQCVGAGGNGQLRFVDGSDAANLDAGSHGLACSVGMINITTQGGTRAKTRGQGGARLCASMGPPTSSRRKAAHAA